MMIEIRILPVVDDQGELVWRVPASTRPFLAPFRGRKAWYSFATFGRHQERPMHIMTEWLAFDALGADQSLGTKG